MIDFCLKNIKSFIYIFLGIIISRAFIYQIYGIEPRLDVIVEHWQNVELSALNENMFSSIFNLHAQPPLWNVFLGLGSKACAANVECIARVGHVFYIILTFMTCCFMHIMLRSAIFKNVVSVVLCIIYSILPSVIFYENYVFYPHIIMFLFSALSVSSYYYY